MDQEKTGHISLTQADLAVSYNELITSETAPNQNQDSLPNRDSIQNDMRGLDHFINLHKDHSRKLMHKLAILRKYAEDDSTTSDQKVARIKDELSSNNEQLYPEIQTQLVQSIGQESPSLIENDVIKQETEKMLKEKITIIHQKESQLQSKAIEIEQLKKQQELQLNSKTIEIEELKRQVNERNLLTDTLDDEIKTLERIKSKPKIVAIESEKFYKDEIQRIEKKAAEQQQALHKKIDDLQTELTHKLQLETSHVQDPSIELIAMSEVQIIREEMKKQQSDFLQKIHLLQEHIKNTADKQSEQIGRLQGQIVNLKEQVNDKVSKIQALQVDGVELSAIVDKLQDQIKGKDGQISILSADLKKQQQQSFQTIKSIQLVFQEKQLISKQFGDKVKTLEITNRQLLAVTDSLTIQLETAKNDLLLANKSEVINEHREEIAKIKLKYNNIKHLLETENQKSKQNEKQLAQQGQQIQKLKAEKQKLANDADKRVKTHEKIVKENKSKISDQEIEIISLKQLLETKNKELFQLTQEILKDQTFLKSQESKEQTESINSLKQQNASLLKQLQESMKNQKQLVDYAKVQQQYISKKLNQSQSQIFKNLEKIASGMTHDQKNNLKLKIKKALGLN